MYVRNSLTCTRALVFYTADVISVAISFVLAYAFRFGSFAFDQSRYTGLFPLCCIVMLFATELFGLMENVLKRDAFQEFLAKLFLSLCMISGTALVLFALKISSEISRLFLMYVTLIFLFVDFVLSGLAAKRLYLNSLTEHALDDKKLPGVFLVTDSVSAEEFIHGMQKAKFRPLQIRGVVFADRLRPGIKFHDLNACGSFDEAALSICRDWIDEVVLYLPLGNAVPESFLSKCREMGVAVHYLVNLGGVGRGKQFVEDFGSYSSITTAFNYITSRQAAAKRCMDIAGGVVGSLIAVIIAIFIGPIIYLNSPGPLFFRQKRVGKNGKYFYLFKFRSMVLDAEAQKKSLAKANRVSDGMMFKLDFDPRIIGNKILPDGTKKTGIGEFIRRTSLDEFPQFFNVLKGDMSIVGTRPPTLDEWEKYEFHHRARLAIKPGITGMWQVSGRSEITNFEEVVRLDTEYITNYRLSLDLKILLKTIPVLLQKRGAL